MTTRSGQSFKPKGTSKSEMTEPSGAEAEMVRVSDMMKLLLEDRKKREEEIAEERRRREEEMAAERRQQQEQIERLMRLVEESHTREAGRASGDKLKSKLTERDDIEAYLTTFERIMVVHGVDRSRWAYKLAPELTGKAQLAYAAMDTAASGDYEELKAAILRRYDINEETYRQRFRAASRKEGETHRELATRLADTVDKWTRECSSVQELRDLIAKEQLLNSLPSDIRVWVSERKPKTSREAGQLADDYLQARRRSQELNKNEQPRRQDKRSHGPIRCYICHQEGHGARECKKSQSGGGPGAVSNRENPQRQDKPVVRCFNCGGRGHISTKCPSNALYCSNRRGRNCTWKPGHSRSGCVYRAGAVEGQAVEDVLLDTGCSRTLVRRDLVPESKRLDGSVAIRCAHGDTVEYPLATVDISIGDQKFTVEAAWVADALPASVLLGTDVPNLVELLHSNSVRQSGRSEAVLAVMTRAQTKKSAEEDPPADGRGEDPNPETMSVEMEQVKPSSDTTDKVDEVVLEVEPEWMMTSSHPEGRE